MSEKLFVLVSNSDPRNPCEIVEPIYNATVAAAMDYQVEMIFSGKAGEILVTGVAKEIPTLSESQENVYMLLQNAHEAGVKIKASKHLILRWGEELIPEVDDIVGAAYIMSEVMASHSETLTY